MRLAFVISFAYTTIVLRKWPEIPFFDHNYHVLRLCQSSSVPVILCRWTEWAINKYGSNLVVKISPLLIEQPFFLRVKYIYIYMYIRTYTYIRYININTQPYSTCIKMVSNGILRHYKWICNHGSPFFYAIWVVEISNGTWGASAQEVLHRERQLQNGGLSLGSKQTRGACGVGGWNWGKIGIYRSVVITGTCTSSTAQGGGGSFTIGNL